VLKIGFTFSRSALLLLFSPDSARKAARELNAFNFTVTWSASPAPQQPRPNARANSTHELCAWRVLRTDLASGASFIASLSIFVGGLPYKDADEEMVSRCCMEPTQTPT
jgi:hypothetical protein